MPTYKLYIKILDQSIRKEAVSLLEHKVLEEKLGLSKYPYGFPNDREYSNISKKNNPTYLFYSGKNYQDLIKIFSESMDKKFNTRLEYNLVNENEEKLSNFKKVLEITKKIIR